MCWSLYLHFGFVYISTLRCLFVCFWPVIFLKPVSLSLSLSFVLKNCLIVSLCNITAPASYKGTQADKKRKKSLFDDDAKERAQPCFSFDIHV
jgi:hypothetical protein